MIAKEYRPTDCRCLVHRPLALFSAANAFRVTWSKPVTFLRYATEMPWPRLRGKTRSGTRHGNVYRSVREKQGIVVYRQRVLQLSDILLVVSLVFRGHDLMKIANIIPSKKLDWFSLWKKLVSRESGGNGAYWGLRQNLKAWRLA